jgi:hypothetical protein
VRRPAARAAALAAPRVPGLPSLPRVAPTRRSLAVGLALLLLALCAYLLARGTSLFALRDVAVQGGPARVDAQVRQALGPLVGTSLVGLDGPDVVRRVEALPTVVSATYDRAFPHTLRLTIVPERPAAVLRRGADAWLLSARGRVMARLRKPQAHPHLPRIWLGSHTAVALGAVLPPAVGGAAARAVGLAGAFATRVGTVTDTGGLLVFHLRSGLEVSMGVVGGIRLKVAVIRRALRVLPLATTYLDVSVPERPVAGTGAPPVLSNPQVSTRG